MPVGRLISNAARDAMSQGETFSVAKLASESTTLPLLTVGCWMAAGFLAIGLYSLGLMRDVVEGTGAGASSATEPSDPLSGIGDSRRLFLDVMVSVASYEEEVLLEEACEVLRSEFEDKCEDRRMSRGMAAGSEI